MAKIPVHDSQIALSSVQSNQIDHTLFSASGKNLSKMSDDLLTIADDFKKIRDTNETTKASTNFQIELGQLQDMATSDPDFGGIEGYEKRINESANKYLSTITDPILKAEYSEKFRLVGYETYSNIQKIKRNKLIENTQYETLKSLSVDHDKYVSTIDAVVRDMMKKNSNEVIDNSFKAGIFSPEAATALRTDVNERWDKDWLVTQAKGAIINDPVGSLKELLKGNQGAWGDIDTSERDQLIDIAKIQITKNKNDIIVAQTKKEREYVDRLFDPQKTPVGLDEITADNTITPAFKQSVISFLVSQPDVKTNPVSYQKLKDKIYMKDGTAAEIEQAILSAPDVSQSDKDHLHYIEKYDDSSTVYESALMERKTGKPDEKRKSGFMHVVMDMVHSMATVNVDKYKSIMDAIATRGKQENAQGEQIIPIANQEIAKQRLRDHPEIASYPPEGVYLHDDISNTWVLRKPDGTQAVVINPNGQRIPKEQRKYE